MLFTLLKARYPSKSGMGTSVTSVIDVAMTPASLFHEGPRLKSSHELMLNMTIIHPLCPQRPVRHYEGHLAKAALVYREISFDMGNFILIIFFAVEATAWMRKV